MGRVEFVAKELDNGDGVVYIGGDGPSKEGELGQIVELFAGGYGADLGVATLNATSDTEVRTSVKAEVEKAISEA
ncbi:MAG: hypothetical protein AAF570_29110, partial [Bacteroidota bacterium]